MDPLIGSALVSGGLGMVSNFLGTEQNNASSMELARYQNEWNLEQWHRENEYNKPVNQVKRLVEAGINPRSQGQVSSMPSASSPQAANADYQSPLNSVSGSLQNMVQMIMQAKSLQKDVELKDSQIEENRAGALKLLGDSDLLHDKRLFEQFRFENWVHRQGILLTPGSRSYDSNGRMKYSLGSYTFDPEYFGLDSKKDNETLQAIFVDNELRRLKRNYERDQAKFRSTTGFNSPKEFIPFLIRVAELIFGK